MSFTNFSVEIDGDGIAVVTWDEPGRSMNVIDSTVMDELSTIVEQRIVAFALGHHSFCGCVCHLIQSIHRLRDSRCFSFWCR